MTDKILPMEKTPVPCKPCDAMVTLGLLTTSCEQLPPAERAQCQMQLKPLETGVGDPVQIMTKMLVDYGPQVDDAIDRMNSIMMSAEAHAKDELIRRGVLNPDGTPKE